MQAINLVNLLSYGAIGLGCVLALFTYFLLHKEQSMQRPRRTMIQAIYVFMGFSLFLSLAGFVYEITTHHEGRRDRTALSALPMEYEWQWAGENWYGQVLLSGRGDTLAVEMARMFKLTKDYSNPKTSMITFSESPVLEGIRGTFAKSATGNAELSLLVNKTTPENPDAYVAFQISGELAQKTCFAGKVEYTNMVTRQRSKGDMILVNYESFPEDITQGRFDPTKRYTTQ